MIWHGRNARDIGGIYLTHAHAITSETLPSIDELLCTGQPYHIQDQPGRPIALDWNRIHTIALLVGNYTTNSGMLT